MEYQLFFILTKQLEYHWTCNLIIFLTKYNMTYTLDDSKVINEKYKYTFIQMNKLNEKQMRNSNYF